MSDMALYGAKHGDNPNNIVMLLTIREGPPTAFTIKKIRTLFGFLPANDITHWLVRNAEFSQWVHTNSQLILEITEIRSES